MTDEARPRRGVLLTWLVSIIGIFTPGIGQMAAGRLKRGVAFLAVICLFFTLSATTNLLYDPHSYSLGCAFLLLCFAFLVVDSMMLNRSHRGWMPQSYNVWYGYLIYATFSMLVFMLFSSSWLFYRTEVTTSSADNMIKKGQYMLVRLNPLWKPGIHWSQGSIHPLQLVFRQENVESGDTVVVHAYLLKKSCGLVDSSSSKPSEINDQQFVRVLAVGGDRLVMRAGKIRINGIAHNPRPWFVPGSPYLQKINLGPLDVPKQAFLLTTIPSKKHPIPELSCAPARAISGLVLFTH